MKPEPWLSDRTHAARRKCHIAERRWKKDKLQVLSQILKDCSQCYRNTVKDPKREYLSFIIVSNHWNLHMLFKTPDCPKFPSVYLLHLNWVITLCDFFYWQSRPHKDCFCLWSLVNKGFCLVKLCLTRDQRMSLLEDVVGHIKPSGSPCHAVFLLYRKISSCYY